MKASVNTTVKSTFSILAAMTFVVACGSKKNNPADAVVGPNAVKTIEGEFKAEGVTCSVGDVTEGNTVVGTILKLTKAGEEGRYVLTETAVGPAQIQNGEYKITEGDTAKGKIQFTKFIYTEGDENGTVSKDEKDILVSDFTFSGDDLILTHKDESVCKAADSVATKTFKRYALPVVPATAPAEVQPGTEGNGQAQPLPATPPAEGAPATGEGEKK